MRYKAIFKDGSQYSLFGSEYFSDKAVFNRSHQSNLVTFSSQVCRKGRPTKILDNGNEIEFKDDSDFDEWFKANQSPSYDFGFSNFLDHESIKKEATLRINKIIEFLKEELNTLSNYRFNPWHHSGGYKELENLCNVGIASFEMIATKMSLSNELTSLKQCFETPKSLILGDHSIISYRKHSHDDIDPKILIKFLNLNIALIEKKTNHNKD